MIKLVRKVIMLTQTQVEAIQAIEPNVSAFIRMTINEKLGTISSPRAEGNIKPKGETNESQSQ